MLLTSSYSDGPTPDKQIEQVLAIYPIVTGQKRSTTNVIPTRSSTSGPSSHARPAVQPPTEQHAAEQYPAEQHPIESRPVEQHTIEQPAPSRGDDLVDFGQNDAPPSAQQQPERKPEQRPALDAHHGSTAEIQSMLSQTGISAPGGPLLNFRQD